MIRHKLNNASSSDNSSSDEDVDCLLQRASDKLGWSSHKNYEDTFQTLLRTVENSKKKKKSYAAKSKRRTPARPRNTKSSSPILSSSEVSTPKRILMFGDDGGKTKEKSETFHNKYEESESLQPSIKSSVTFSLNYANLNHGKISPTLTKFNICKDHESSANCTKCKSENISRGRISPETLSDVNSSVDDGSCKLDSSGNHHGNQHNSCVVTNNDPPWLNHRGDNVAESTSSDSEEDKSLPAVTLQDEENREEEDVFEDSLPRSLSQRLVDNFRKKKEENDGGLHSDQGCKEKDSQTKKPLHHRDSSSSDDDFETFLMKMKTPKKIQSSCNQYVSDDDDDDFINDGPLTEGEEDEEDEYLLHVKLNSDIRPADNINNARAILGDHTNKVKSFDDGIVTLSSPDESEDEDDVFVPAVKPKVKVKNKENFLCTPKTPINNKPVLERKISFLESLNTPPVGTPVRSEFVKDFKKRKEELAQRLFTMFNKTVFDGKLPVDMEIRWNKRMRKTAGYCVYTKQKLSATRNVRLELSEKVCDSAERLRDTLVHEMCHAACWLINGVNDGHGRYWKYWASKANMAHPEIPVVKRCHSYEIHTKYKYQCQQCKAVVGRHSKSLDVNKKCCGLCKGRFVLLPPENQKQKKSQQPNKFALFVKENYATVKKSNEYFKHADVMRTLSQEFARKATLGN